MVARRGRGCLGVVVVVGVLAAGCAARPDAGQPPPDPARAAVDELLEADRASAAASSGTDVVSGLVRMFAADVVMPLPDGRFAMGRDEAVEALRANPDNAGSRLEWAPVRGGISSDGLQGFTFGYMTLHLADSTAVPLKYLAYWVKGAEGWRVAGYKRARSAGGEHPTGMMEPSLPPSIVAPSADSALTRAHGESLRLAEQAFSDEAQVIGLGPAFAKFGRADAVNLGGPAAAAFVVGADSIARLVGQQGPETGSAVSWAADWVLVASSGDLGVTFGWIRLNLPLADGTLPPARPFFTIWRRAGPTGPWRYIAE